MGGRLWIAVGLLVVASLTACVPRRVPEPMQPELTVNGKWALVSGERAGMWGFLTIEGRSGQLVPLDEGRETVSVTLIADGPGWLVVPEGEVGDALRLSPTGIHEYLVFHPKQTAELALRRVGTLPVSLQNSWILQRDVDEHFGVTRAENGELRLVLNGRDVGLVVPLHTDGEGVDLLVMGPGGGLIRLAPAGSETWIAHLGGRTGLLYRPDRAPDWVETRSRDEVAEEFGLGGPEATVSAPDLVHDADAMWRVAGDLALQLASVPDSENVRRVADLLDAVAAGIGKGEVNPVRFVSFKAVFGRVIEDGIVNDAERESLEIASPIERE